jgi:hypothetical protein
MYIIMCIGGFAPAEVRFHCSQQHGINTDMVQVNVDFI